MIYYNYSVGGKEFQLTADEHKKSLPAMDQGKKFLVLRGGELVINPSFIRSIEIDFESVEKEAKARREKDDLKKLPDISDAAKKERYEKEREKIDQIREELTIKLGWNDDKTTSDKTNL